MSAIKIAAASAAVATGRSAEVAFRWEPAAYVILRYIPVGGATGIRAVAWIPTGDPRGSSRAAMKLESLRVLIHTVA